MVEVVERRVPKTRITKDLFGFIDILAIEPREQGCLGIQATTGSNHAARRKKILGHCHEQAEKWLAAGNRIEVWSWRKLKKGGWQPRIEEITLLELR